MSVVTFPTTPTPTPSPREPKPPSIRNLDLALSAVIDAIQQASDRDTLRQLYTQLRPLVETACRLEGMCLTRLDEEGTVKR